MSDAATSTSVVELRIPAHSAYVAVLRSVAAGLAARCDLTLDDIEDLRIAVDEACALLLPNTDADAVLLATFALNPGELAVTASVPAGADADADQSGFAWTVLGALATTVTVATEPERMAITLVKARETAAP